MNPTIEAKIRASFAAQSLMETFGARLAALGPGTCRLEAEVGANARQQMGFAHAGLTFALGDTAAGYAALTLMPEEDEVVTAEIKINLLAPATGASLRAEGRVLKAGRRLVVVASDVWCDEVHVAALQGTMLPIRPRA